MTFLIVENTLHCQVSSRATDVVTGLPYDIGFFSIVNEMLFQKLLAVYPDLTLGDTVMQSTFTQLYDSKMKWADKIASFQETERIMMPEIKTIDLVMDDIKNGTKNSDFFQWLVKHG